MLNNRSGDYKTIRRAIIMAMSMRFFDIIAAFANEKFSDVTGMCMITGNISVQGFNAVYKS